MPSLIQKQTEKATVVKLKKAYSTLSNAYMLAQNEYGQTFAKDAYYYGGSYKSASAEFFEKLKPFLEIASECKSGQPKCFQTINGRIYYYPFLEKKGTGFWNGYNNSKSMALLKDGTLIIVYADYGYLSFLVDVNGSKGPNHYGHDTFFFRIQILNGGDINKILPEKPGLFADCKFNSSNQASGCAWWVITNENLDYLHCNLDWNTQTKCM